MSNLRRIKQEKNLTTLELSRMTGISRQMINFIETGKRKGSIETNLKLASVLGVTLDELVGKEVK